MLAQLMLANILELSWWISFYGWNLYKLTKKDKIQISKRDKIYMTFWRKHLMNKKVSVHGTLETVYIEKEHLILKIKELLWYLHLFSNEYSLIFFFQFSLIEYIGTEDIITIKLNSLFENPMLTLSNDKIQRYYLNYFSQKCHSKRV